MFKNSDFEVAHINDEAEFTIADVLMRQQLENAKKT